MSGNTKVADMASQLQERIPLNRSSFMRFYEWYHKTYFKTGRITPVVHVMAFVGIVGYSLEHPHIKHEQEMAKKEAEKVE